MEQQDEKIKSYERRRQSPSPIDLTSEILLKLPEKSVVRFRCVSKLWLSISTDPYFINLFETRHPRPSLLLCFIKDENLYVSSIPQDTHTLHLNKTYSSSQPIESYHMKFPGEEYNHISSTESVHGLVCFQAEKPIVWNPSKRQFLTLPKPTKNWNALKVFLGYDPVEGKYKLMCMPLDNPSVLCQVLTLGSAQQSWRTVKTSHNYYCVCYLTGGIFLEGVIYYLAYTYQTRVGVLVVMSFDVRSEKFDMIKLPSDMNYRTILVTYQGKLAFVKEDGIVLWILEDAKKHEWSSHDYSLPPSDYYNMLLSTPPALRCCTHVDEFIFVPYMIRKPSNVLFYDPVTKISRRIEFEGIAEGQQFVEGQHWLHAFPNHIESQISL